MESSGVLVDGWKGEKLWVLVDGPRRRGVLVDRWQGVGGAVKREEGLRGWVEAGGAGSAGCSAKRERVSEVLEKEGGKWNGTGGRGAG